MGAIPIPGIGYNPVVIFPIVFFPMAIISSSNSPMSFDLFVAEVNNDATPSFNYAKHSLRVIYDYLDEQENDVHFNLYDFRKMWIEQLVQDFIQDNPDATDCFNRDYGAVNMERLIEDFSVFGVDNGMLVFRNDY